MGLTDDGQPDLWRMARSDRELSSEEVLQHRGCEPMTDRERAYRRAIKILDGINDPMVDAENLIDPDGSDSIFDQLFNGLDALSSIAHEGIWKEEERQAIREANRQEARDRVEASEARFSEAMQEREG